MEEESCPNEASQQLVFFGNTGPKEGGEGSCRNVARQQLSLNTQHTSHSYEHRELNQRREIGAADSQNRHLFNVRLEEYINCPPPLGLRLRKTQALMKFIEERLNASEDAKKCLSGPKKLPAAHFVASFLAIGEFKVVAANESDLVARCYYGKRRLVWEILDRGTMLKRKIEVPWQNISAMRAITKRNRLGILEIELEKGPMIYRETHPRPQCHSTWELSEDFTGGHALRYRRHYLEFPDGVLNKHYERMIQCDSRLLELSKRPFPSLDSPFFYSNLLYEAALRYSQGYDLCELVTNPASHHQPALVFSTQQVEQFGNTLPSSLTYSTPPTSSNACPQVNVCNDPPLLDPNMSLTSEGLDGYANMVLTSQGLDSYANMALSQGLVGYANMAPAGQGLDGYGNMALTSQAVDGHANILQSYSMPGTATEVESRPICENFSNFVNMLVADFDIHMGLDNSSSTIAGPILMETDPAYNNTCTSTQNNCFPNTMVDSMDALAPWSEEHYFACNANMNGIYGALSNEGGSQLNAQALQHTTSLHAANQKLENHLPETLHPNYFVPECSTIGRDNHDYHDYHG